MGYKGKSNFVVTRGLSITLTLDDIDNIIEACGQKKISLEKKTTLLDNINLCLRNHIDLSKTRHRVPLKKDKSALLTNINKCSEKLGGLLVKLLYDYGNDTFDHCSDEFFRCVDEKNKVSSEQRIFNYEGDRVFGYLEAFQYELVMLQQLMLSGKRSLDTESHSPTNRNDVLVQSLAYYYQLAFGGEPSEEYHQDTDNDYGCKGRLFNYIRKILILAKTRLANPKDSQYLTIKTEGCSLRDYLIKNIPKRKDLFSEKESR